MKNLFWPLVLMVGLIGITLTSCGVNPDQATRSLAAYGMTDIKIGGFALLGCSDNDSFRSTFTAIGANGQPVSGVVCSGVFKGITVRFD